VLKTVLCDVLGIDVPIILGPMAVFTSPAAMAAAVSNYGGLGSIGTLFRTTDEIKRDIDEARELTNRSYAVNHIPKTLRPKRSAIPLQRARRLSPLLSVILVTSCGKLTTPARR
jgi:NAD(P)H-dependent flavin oxidoreductase YrpB (nitropropane dioxygenase family)